MLEKLNEVAMNFRNFADMYSNPDFKAGFEVEFVLDHTSPMFAAKTTTLEGETINLVDLSTILDFDKYFIGADDLEQDYNDWCEAEIDKVLQQWEDDSEDPVSDQFEFRAKNFNAAKRAADISLEDYLESKFGVYVRRDKNFAHLLRMRAIDEFGMRPRYGWEDSDMTALYQTAPSKGQNASRINVSREVAFQMDLAGIAPVSMITIPRGDKVTTKNLSHWYIEPDTSVIQDNEAEEDYYGLEIVSPPMTMKHMFESLDEVFKFISDQGLKTNSSTAIHIGISLDGLGAQDFDHLKMMILINEDYLLNVFERKGNTYANAQLEQMLGNLIVAVENNKVDPKILKNVNAFADHLLKLKFDGKYYSINFTKLLSSNPYIELRFAGNAKYETKLDEIKRMTLRAAYVLMLAKDPDAERKEYLKKLYKIMDKVKDALKKDPAK